MCALVGEDEALVRAVAVAALEAEGFEVAPSADHAVTLLPSRDAIDVVFTEPGTLNGFDLARFVRKPDRVAEIAPSLRGLMPG